MAKNFGWIHPKWVHNVVKLFRETAYAAGLLGLNAIIRKKRQRRLAASRLAATISLSKLAKAYIIEGGIITRMKKLNLAPRIKTVEVKSQVLIQAAGRPGGGAAAVSMSR